MARICILVNVCSAVATLVAVWPAPVLGALPSALDVRTFSSVIKGGLVEPGASERERALRSSHSTFTLLPASVGQSSVCMQWPCIHCEMRAPCVKHAHAAVTLCAGAECACVCVRSWLTDANDVRRNSFSFVVDWSVGNPHTAVDLRAIALPPHGNQRTHTPCSLSCNACACMAPNTTPVCGVITVMQPTPHTAIDLHHRTSVTPNTTHPVHRRAIQ
jgi:hypothetical protein